MVDTSYAPGGGSAASAAAPEQSGGRTLSILKQDYLSYLDGKVLEIREQQESRRYYHASQWTSKQIRTFNIRKQPIVTFNRVGRKINAVVGLLEKQRQDPRGFPRTPQHEEGAEVATAVVRYVLDEQRWKEKSPIVGLNGAVDGIGGIELVLEPGDMGDTEVGFEVVEPSGFFYDPRSTRADFSDAQYMGIGKWADVNELKATFPDKANEIDASAEQGTELTSNPDTDMKWVMGDVNHRRVRVIDEWYKRGNEWFWCIFTGGAILAEGPSYLRDEKKRTICKYIMFSANVDHDGDRYGFVRNMKSSQDEINQRRSKGLHILNSRRIVMEDGQGLDVEEVRKEAARPDGVIKHPAGTKPPEFDDVAKAQELNGHLGFLQEAKEEIENYGFNPALMGTGVQDMSGRAIALQQQAGIAELGPYLLGYKGWKLRVYRAIWNAVQEHWTAQRWIRVTDDQQLAQFFQINKVGIDQRTGTPAIINQLGSLDVDIIMDEGPDEINMQADAYDTLSIMASKGAQIPPALLIELSPLAGSVKTKALSILEQAQQPNPIQQRGVMLELQGKEIENEHKQADALKKRADATLSMARAASEGQGQGGADPAQLAFDKWKALLESYTSIKIAEIGKGEAITTAAMDAEIDRFLGLSGLQSDQIMQLRDHAHQRVMLAMQPPPAPAAA